MHRAVVVMGTKLVVLLAAAFIAVVDVRAVDFSIGGPEVIYTKSQRKSAPVLWPDGNLGVDRQWRRHVRLLRRQRLQSRS